MKWKVIVGVPTGVILLAVGYILLAMGYNRYNRTTPMPTIDANEEPQTRNWVPDEADGDWLIDTESIKATTIFPLVDDFPYYWTLKLIGKGVKYDRKLKNPEMRNKGLKLLIDNTTYSCETSDPIAIRILRLAENHGDYTLARGYIGDPRDRMRGLPSQQSKSTYGRYFEAMRARCRQAGVEPKF